MKRILSNERGFAALLALIMVGMLTLIGLAALTTSDDEVQIAGNELREMRAFYAAEAGLEYASAKIQQAYDTTGAPPTTMPVGADSVNGFSVNFTTVDLGPAQKEVLSTGTLAGLNALVKEYDLRATADNTADNTSMTLAQTFQAALVPIFQFAVFYGEDLEIAPGPDMTLLGRVHSNGNLYIQSNNSLYIDSYVTASGHIIHGRKGPGSVGSGDIMIKDASGNYVSMADGSDWLESSDAHWYDSSVARWDGRVQDSTHGARSLHLPLGATGDEHKIIEPAAGGNSDSYEHNAGLKYINGDWFYQVGGLWQNVTSDLQTAGVITGSTTTFYDGREGENVDAIDVDINALYSTPYAPTNGIMYFSQDVAGNFPALRIKNGAQIDTGLTIASANPLYVEGDFNSVNKKPAALMADAITILSNNWNDANSTLSKSSRPATQTTVNASMIAGNVETTSTNYNGGFENLPRFLETWSGVEFEWRGSMVNLFYSQQATGIWGSSYYDPPDRDWAYDFDLDDPANLPPGTPMVRVFIRTGWHQEHVGVYKFN